MHLNLGIPAFLPVMNARQQLAALYPDFGTSDSGSRVALFQQWKEKEHFEKLSGIRWLLAIDDVLALPADLHMRVNPSRIFLCVPEACCGDKDIQTKLGYLMQNGFQILLDPFESVLELSWHDTRHIAINCRAGVPFHARSWATKLSGGQTLASHLPTYLEFDQAVVAGMNLFSGDYAFAPAPDKRSVDGSAKSRLLKLLGLVAQDADTPELEELFRQDPALSFQLLKLVSSAAFAQPVRITSFTQAINLLGRRQLQRWLQLLLYARQHDQPGALNPLMPRAAFRASLMESLCAAAGASKDDLDGAFMVGMFSLLDKLFGADLKEVLQPLNLNEPVLSALLERKGKLGRCLQLVEVADRQYQENIQTLFSALELDADLYVDCVLKAYCWVHQICRDM